MRPFCWTELQRLVVLANPYFTLNRFVSKKRTDLTIKYFFKFNLGSTKNDPGDWEPIDSVKNLEFPIFFEATNVVY